MAPDLDDLSVMIMQSPRQFFHLGFLLCAALFAISPTTHVHGQSDTKVVSGISSDRSVIRLGGGREIKTENTDELLIRSVAQSNPTTPVELSKALGWMLDIKRFDKAKEYLGKLANADLDGQGSYELNRDAGSDLFYRIARSPELQPQGRELALKVFRAASKWANSEERISKLVDEVATGDAYQRGESFAKLNRIGKKAVAKVIETFADQEREEQFPALRGALYAFGNAALDPLLGAAEASEPAVRIESLRALAKLKDNRAVDMLQRTALSQETPSPYRELAGYHLANSGQATDVAQAEQRLRERVERFLTGRHDPADDLLGTIESWSWDSEAGKLEVSEIKSDIGARVRAAELARTLFEINPHSAVNRELHLITELESQKRQVGASEAIDVEQYLKLTENIHAVEVEQLLVKAIELDLMHAATAACEVLKEIGSEAQIVGSHRCPLVNAILVGDRHLQFAAFDAIAKINPKTAYAGSSYVLEVAAWLAGSRFTQQVAVGHFENQKSQAWVTAAGPMGWDGMVANSSQSFFEGVAANPDVAILVISDTLRRPAHRELVHQLRSHWKTKRMPIGLLSSSSDKFIKSVRYTEGIDRLLTFPLTVDAAAIRLQLEQLVEKVSPWAVSNDDRYRHAARAVQWLEKATVDPQLSFYNFSSHQEQLLGLLYHPEFTEAAANILSTQPTAVAQRAMLGFVSQGDLPIEARTTVVDAFEKAVQRSGAMLTGREIRLQYERYNASEGLPKETQALLGRVLDVLEAKREKLR